MRDYRFSSAGGFALYSVQITRATRDDVKDTALGIARTLADSPEIQRGLMQAPQENIIQPIARAVTKRNDLLFTVVTDMRGIRYSHPNEALLGLHFIGDDLTPALEGKENVSVNRGALAEALRVLRPSTTRSTSRLAWWSSESPSIRLKSRSLAGG